MTIKHVTICDEDEREIDTSIGYINTMIMYGYHNLTRDFCNYRCFAKWAQRMAASHGLTPPYETAQEKIEATENYGTDPFPSATKLVLHREGGEQWITGGQKT